MQLTLFLSLIVRLSIADAGRTTEAEEAAINDVSLACSPYNYAPVDAILSGYPGLYATANLKFPGILPEDLAVFTAMQPNIPKIAPRGTRTGDLTGTPVYPQEDPDCWWTFGKCTTPKIAGIPPDVTRCDEPNTWGYTLDDGPSCEHNQLFNYLDTINQKATLFYIGSNVLALPLEAQRGLTDGHEICSHTWSHPYMTALTDAEVFAELYYSQKAIYDVLGITVQCWRPPSGDIDDRIRFIANELGMRTILWQYDVNDWKHSILGVPAVQAFYDTVISMGNTGAYKHSGTIVLSHEIDSVTMGMSQSNLPAIAKAFTGGVMPVAVCMNNTQPYLQKEGFTYPNAAQWVAGTHSISLLAPTAGLAAPMVPVSLLTSPTSIASVGTITSTGATSAQTGLRSSGSSTSPATTKSAVPVNNMGSSQVKTAGVNKLASVSLGASLGFTFGLVILALQS